MPAKKAGDAPQEFDPNMIKDDAFYQVRLSRSTRLYDEPLAAANSVRLSGSAVKVIAADVFTADEIPEDAPHDIMRSPEEGVLKVATAV